DHAQHRTESRPARRFLRGVDRSASGLDRRAERARQREAHSSSRESCRRHGRAPRSDGGGAGRCRCELKLTPAKGNSMSYRDILVETRDRVGVIRLNRPQRMNALSDALAAELATALAWFDADANIGAIVITGNEKAFAAGADIGNMAEWDYQKVYADNY